MEVKTHFIQRVGKWRWTMMDEENRLWCKLLKSKYGMLDEVGVEKRLRKISKNNNREGGLKRISHGSDQ
ncbi:hypothetical protein CR513_40812, partial [Mucuna pruriens]